MNSITGSTEEKLKNNLNSNKYCTQKYQRQHLKKNLLLTIKIQSNTKTDNQNVYH